MEDEVLFCFIDAPNVAVCGIIQNLNYEKR